MTALRPHPRGWLPAQLVCLLVGALALSGCGLLSDAEPGGVAATPSPAGTPDSATRPAPAPDPDPEAASPPTFALTGLPASDAAARQRPVLAAKIDNAPGARPQTGIRHADVVLVELVESATRFIAMFHSTDPGRFGPVRSGRFVDAALLPPFEPVMALSGAARPVLARLRGAGLQLYGEGSAGAWARSGSRPAPHNLYAAAAPLWRAGQQAGLPPAEAAWTFDSDEPRGAQVAERADLIYPQATSVTWQFHHRTGRWRRSQDGAPHRVTSGEQVDADNVVIVRVPSRGDHTRPFEPIAAGDLTVLRGRRQVDGTWHKPAADLHFRWRDVAGDPLPLLPGRTWVELVPTSGSVAVR